MKAILINKDKSLSWSDVPDPIIKPDEVLVKIESGLIKPTIYKTFPIQQAEEAHDVLKRGENVGKVVLQVK